MTPAPRRRQPYLLYCDDSGGEDDALRAVAAVSGPARVMLALERELRQVLRLTKVDELKWAGLRTRAPRLEAARAFLELAALGAAAGALRLDVLLWRPADQPLAVRRRDEPGRLRPVYARLWARAAKAWPGGRWNVHPDQRTGMHWHRHPPELKAAWRRGGGGLRSLKEATSRKSACVQLADLLAGLCRVSAGSGAARAGLPGERAARNRLALRAHFVEACGRRGLALRDSQGLLAASRPKLSIQLLRRLPVTA